MHKQGDLSDLGDFTTGPRVITISAMAVAIGFICAYRAGLLREVVAPFNNLFFFQRVSTAMASPASHSLGWLVVVVPVIGALIIGVMARYGSERIRGHGIPE